MADVTPKPKRRRRRWITVGALMFAVPVTAWWRSPRADARLVGQWELFHSEESEPYGHMHFYLNGTSEFTPATGRHYPQSGGWRVDGNNLFMSSRKLATRVAPAVRTIEKWIGRRFSYLDEDDPLEITSVTADEILLQKAPRANHNLTFRRVSK